jgi:hypothetical protein
VKIHGRKALCEMSSGVGPLMEIFRRRNEVIIEDGNVDDKYIAALNRMDALIIDYPATSPEDVIVKMTIIVANLALGHVTVEADAMRVIDEARAHGWEVKLA